MPTVTVEVSRSPTVLGPVLGEPLPEAGLRSPCSSPFPQLGADAEAVQGDSPRTLRPESGEAHLYTPEVIRSASSNSLALYLCRHDPP